MEWIEGIKLNDLGSLRARGIDSRELGLSIIKLFADMIYFTGFVHGDPHPGNFLIEVNDPPPSNN